MILFNFPHLHYLHHDIALFFGYLVMYNYCRNISRRQKSKSLHRYCKTAPNHHSLTLIDYTLLVFEFKLLYYVPAGCRGLKIVHPAALLCVLLLYGNDKGLKKRAHCGRTHPKIVRPVAEKYAHRAQGTPLILNTAYFQWALSPINQTIVYPTSSRLSFQLFDHATCSRLSSYVQPSLQMIDYSTSITLDYVHIFYLANTHTIFFPFID